MGAPGLAFETWDPGNELILGESSDLQCTRAFVEIFFRPSVSKTICDLCPRHHSLTSLLPRLRRLELRPKRRLMHRLLMQ